MTRSKPRIVLALCPVALSALVASGAFAAGRAQPADPVAFQAGPAAQVDQVAATQNIVSRSATRNDGNVYVTLKLKVGFSGDLVGDRLAVGATHEPTRQKATLVDAAARQVFQLSSEERAGLSSTGDITSATDLSDLDSWYTVRVPAGEDPDTFVRGLATDPTVETAYINLQPVNATIDYSGRQHYTGAAPTGIGQAAAAKVAGGLGENVHIFDIEGNWNLKHEDLPAITFIANGTFYDNSGTDDPLGNTNHGTAVLGEIVGKDNGIGVTGIVPRAGMSVVNASSKDAGVGIAQAILLAAAHAKAGDVILIEQQYNLDWQKGGYWQNNVPVEYQPADYEAIKKAVAKGVIVVEAAGNGRYNQDTRVSSGNNIDQLLNHADSGAIMVGAGQVAGCEGDGPDIARSRADFSNYGARVDVQGPGECVTTLGYGNLSKGTGQNSWYTWSFSGTSSASPVVTGAAAALSSIIEARTGRPATPSEVRALLKKTGTAQDTTVAGHIGPMPDMSKAIAALASAGNDLGGDQGDLGGNGGSDTAAPVVSGPHAAPAVGYAIAKSGIVPTTVWWSAKDASGIAVYDVLVSTDGGEWADVTTTSASAIKATLDLSAGHTYRFAVAAKDGAGNWSEWRLGATFTPSLDDDTDPNLAYAGSWTRAAWSNALDGAVTKTRTAGDTVTIDFQGGAIAWIASRGTNRGAAHVWLDGVDLGTVNLYSETTQARVIVFSRAVATGVDHELVIQAIGAIDLDGLAFLG